MDKPENTLTPDCERLRELLPAYGFGITDAEETRLVEQLLPLCPEVAAELDDYETLSDAMLFSAPPLQPPAHLLTQIMDAAAKPAAPVVVLPRRRWLIPAAAAAVIVLLLINIGLILQLTSSVNENTRLAGQVNVQTAMLSLAATDRLLKFELTDQREEGDARAVVLCNPEETVVLVQAENFPPLPPEMAYHIWLWRDEQKTSGGWLRVNEEGQGTLVFNAPQEMGLYQYIGLSPEPLGNKEVEFEPLVKGQLYKDG